MIRLIIGVISFMLPISSLILIFVEPVLWPNYQIFFDNWRIFVGISSLVLMIGLSIYCLRSRMVPSEKRGLWITVLFCANIFAFPFFWFWYMRKKDMNLQG